MDLNEAKEILNKNGFALEEGEMEYRGIGLPIFKKKQELVDWCEAKNPDHDAVWVADVMNGYMRLGKYKMYDWVQSWAINNGIDYDNAYISESLTESHVQGHCAMCGKELWSDEAFNRYEGKRYCDYCYEEVAKPKGKFRTADIYFYDINEDEYNNVGLEIRDCPAQTEKEAKEFAIKKFKDKIYDGFYDDYRGRCFRNIKIEEVEVG